VTLVRQSRVPRDDLDAAAAGLAQDGRDAFAIFDGDRYTIDAARDPGLDHFVLLRRIGVGRAVPDQLDSQLASRFFRSLSAGDEVGVALALGHHGDGNASLRKRRRRTGRHG